MPFTPITPAHPSVIQTTSAEADQDLFIDRRKDMRACFIAKEACVLHALVPVQESIVMMILEQAQAGQSWACRHHPLKVLCQAQGLHKRVID